MTAIPGEIAARAVCAAEVAEWKEERRRKYVEENWCDRHAVMVPAYARYMRDQGVRMDVRWIEVERPPLHFPKIMVRSHMMIARPHA